MMSGEGKLVCVTGGSGYIASWLVKLLLQRGYTVKATVSDLSKCVNSLLLLLILIFKKIFLFNIFLDLLLETV